jgi:hypothetical protein
VSFVENVNLEPVASGTIACGLAKFTDFVDAAVGGGVDLDYIDGVSGANLGAGFADSTRFRHGLVGRAAVQSRGQNPRHGGFSNAAMAAENVTVRRSFLLESILQGTGNVLLADDLGEFLRTIFTRQDGIAHAGRDDYT